MKILVFGSLNIDLIFMVDHIASPGETVSGNSFIKSAGGKGANQAAALAKAGMPVYMAGKIGRDGEFLAELLESYGVNTGGIVRYEGATGQAIIQLDHSRQNAIVLYSGGNGAISADEVTAALNEFSAGDLVVLQNEISCLRDIMEGAKKRGMRISFNPSPCNEKIAELPLELVDIFFVNEIEGAALVSMPPRLPSEILDRLVECFPLAEIILTAGKDGAYYGCGTYRAKGDIIDTPVADTTGAGDTFTGYFLAAREKGMPVTQALAAACKASSIAVSRMGAMESIPFAAEVFCD
ncbi:MAG: ribokinase [Treponema sp.]|jgi:ribokinase|nr:ribokinase [Treponema sp.]